MGPTEVLQILGRPDHVVRSRSELRPIWIYHEAGLPFGSMTEFDRSGWSVTFSKRSCAKACYLAVGAEVNIEALPT